MIDPVVPEAKAGTKEYYNKQERKMWEQRERDLETQRSEEKWY